MKMMNISVQTGIALVCSVFQGPPPDPSYNYLADRSRDGREAAANNWQVEKPISQESGGGGGGGRGSKETRRHPRNFGGADFSNVKTQMKAVKEKVSLELFVLFMFLSCRRRRWCDSVFLLISGVLVVFVHDF